MVEVNRYNAYTANCKPCCGTPGGAKGKTAAWEELAFLKAEHARQQDSIDSLKQQVSALKYMAVK